MKKNKLPFSAYTGFLGLILGITTVTFFSLVKPLFGLPSAYFSLYGSDPQTGWLFNISLLIVAGLLIWHLTFLQKQLKLELFHPLVFLSVFANEGLLLLALFPTTTPSVQHTIHTVGTLLFIFAYPLVIAAASVVVYQFKMKKLAVTLSAMALLEIVGLLVLFTSRTQLIWGQLWAVCFASAYTILITYVTFKLHPAAAE